MIRRIVWFFILPLLVFGVGFLWFVTHYEQVPITRHVAPEAEARHNPYLALEQLMDKLGRPVLKESKISDLATLPDRGVLILGQGRSYYMGPERIEHLLHWVEQGGYLIVVPERYYTEDPFLDYLGVNRVNMYRRLAEFKAEQNKQSEEVEEVEEVEESAQAALKNDGRPRYVSVTIPGTTDPLFMTFQNVGLLPEESPDWHSEIHADAAQVLHYGRGKGHITVVSGFDDLLNNQNIGDEDHAALLWTLVQTYQGDSAKPIWLMVHLEGISIWEWLATTGWTATLSALVLIALWLWRLQPRFGPTLPEADPDRRELREHLAALGRYVWKAGGLNHWLNIARERFFSHLSMRHPALAVLPPEQQAEALAKLSNYPQSLILDSLYGQVQSSQQFTRAMGTLRNLEHVL